MKKIFTFFCFLFVLSVAVKAADPELINIKDAQGFDRQYYRYLPATYDESKPSVLMVCLHAFGRSGADFFGEFNMGTMGDLFNIVIVAPNALPEQDPAVTKTLNDNIKDFPTNALWGCGMKINVTVHGIVIGDGDPFSFAIVNTSVNSTVNDYAFIKQVIDSTKASYNISADDVFMFGMSMGGMMAYQYALWYGQDLAGLISINGTQGSNIYKRFNRKALPICDFHTVDDEVLFYEGPHNMEVWDEGSQVFRSATVTMGDAKSEVIKAWIGSVKNNCNPEPDSLYFDSIANSTTGTKYTYKNETTGNDYIHYKMKGGNHSYGFSLLNGDCLDYSLEIAQFLYDHSPLLQSMVDVKDLKAGNVAMYQDITTNTLNFKDLDVDAVAIYGIDGSLRLSLKGSGNSYDVSSLKAGVYVAKISVNGQTIVKKFVKK